MIKNNWEDNMLNKFRYKNWTFVEYINPKNSRSPKDGTWSNGLYTTKYIRPADGEIYGRIMDWFKHIESDKPDMDVIWDSLDDDEANEWFKNSKSDFRRWWDSLSDKLKHYYADRLESGKSLLPDELPGVPDIPKEVKGSLSMTVINDKLALSCVEMDILDRAKEMIEAVRGVTAYEYRTTTNKEGRKVHTYIFDLK